MRDPRAAEFTSPAAYRLALISAEQEADRLTTEAWARFQDQVRRSDPADYESEDAYLSALVAARLETAEIDSLMTAARQRHAAERELESAERERLRRARERYERDAAFEEDRMEMTYELMRRRHGLEDPDYWLEGLAAEHALAQIRERYPADRYGRLSDSDERCGPWAG